MSGSCPAPQSLSAWVHPLSASKAITLLGQSSPWVIRLSPASGGGQEQALLGSWPEPPPPCCNVLHAVWDKQGAQVCFNTPLSFFFSQETRPNSWSAMRREEYSAGLQRGRRQEPVEALARQPCAPTGSSTKWRAQTQCLGCKRNSQGLPSNGVPKRRPQAAEAPYPELWPWITQDTHQ